MKLLIIHHKLNVNVPETCFIACSVFGLTASVSVFRSIKSTVLRSLLVCRMLKVCNSVFLKCLQLTITTRRVWQRGKNKNGDMDASAPCASDVMSASRLGRKKDFIMMPPVEKLTHFDRRAQVHEDNQEVGVHFSA